MRPVVSFAKAQEVGGSRILVSEEPLEGAKVWSAGASFGNWGSRFSSRYLASAYGALRPGAGVELTASWSQGLAGLTNASGGSHYRSGTVGASVVTPWGIYGATYNAIRYGSAAIAPRRCSRKATLHFGGSRAPSFCTRTRRRAGR